MFINYTMTKTSVINDIKELAKPLLKCLFRGHIVSKEDKERVLKTREYLRTKCPRCRTPILVYPDKKDPDAVRIYDLS